MLTWPRTASVELESSDGSLVILGTATIRVELRDWEMLFFFFFLIREAYKKARKLIMQNLITEILIKIITMHKLRKGI